MPTINVYDKPDMARLAYAQKDMMQNLVYNQAFPAMDAMSESGKFREVEARTHYLQLQTAASKFTTPMSYQYKDAFRYFGVKPISAAFEFSNADLAQPTQYGYASAAAMIQSRLNWMTGLLKKKKEIDLYAFVCDNNNYESAAYYNVDASVAWSTVATADPVSDIAAGRLLLESSGVPANALIFSATAYNYLQRCVTLKSNTNVNGPRRDGSVDPTVTPEYLKNLFQVEYLWIARGQKIADSDVAATETRSEIWGDKALLFYHNPTPGPEEPSFMKHLFWKPGPGAESGEGWLVNETVDPEPGGVGVRKWGIWNYYQYLAHEKTLGYRINNLY